MAPCTNFAGLISQCFWMLALLCFVHNFPQPAHAQEQEARRPAPRATVVDCLAGKKLTVIKPADTQYASYSSPYNLRLQYKPAAIVVASSNQHVSDAVLCAAQYNLKVQPRSGGHSYGSYGTGGKDGAVVIDMQKFQNISLDKNTNIATFGAGLRLGNLELALRSSGRALPHGTCANVGVGGHFTIGGDGFTTRAYGLAIDSLVGMDVVLANGSVVHATSTQHKDVFFAMKGAGASFGIATTFYAQTFAYPKALTGIYLTWPGLSANTEKSVSALKHIQNYANNATSGLDRKFQFDVTLDAFGNFILKGTYLGPIATFNKTVLPELLRGLPTPAASDSDSPTYVKEYAWTDALIDANYGSDIAYPKPGESGYVPTPDHDTFYTKSLTVPAPGLPETAIRNLVAWGQAHQQGKNPAVAWYFTLSLQGGVDNQIFLDSKSGDSAFWRRDTTWVMELSGFPDGADLAFPVPAGIDLVNDLDRQVTGVLGAGNYGAYQGYVDTELSAEQAGRLYYGDVLFEKLKGLKKKIDPGNLFSNPQSIPVGT
ncbi:glucooligosaccharide oxidase [Diaporthe helianthi]|uniref:Glucooligosaccharide oxidase n=1 Tax=Diaporthe helianthi TaxID=158607 RepID=A0A2P5HPN4_DIAHE|nr:glucooligosaccharide oxidase [Diaporthe helianthi]